MRSLEEASNKKWCVYKHTTPVNKVYIGITSRRPQERWGVNIANYRAHPHFWNAIKKYDWNNIKHEVLFENLSEDEAKEKEKELIIYHKSNDRKFGYNMTDGGEGKSGYKLSEETKKKISLAHMGKVVSEEEAARLRTMNIGRKHTEQAILNMTKANKKHGISEENRKKMNAARIGIKLSDEHKKALGKKSKENWQNNEYRSKILAARKGKIKRGSESSSAKAVLQYNLQGQFIQKFGSISEANASTGVDMSSIIRCCNGVQQKAGGYIWKYYIGNEIPFCAPYQRIIQGRSVVQLTPKGEIVKVYRNISEAFNETGIHNITTCCKGRQKLAGGFMWKYTEDFDAPSGDLNSVVN